MKKSNRKLEKRTGKLIDFFLLSFYPKKGGNFMKYVKRILLFLLIALVVVASVILLNGYKMHASALEQQSLADKVSEIQNSDNFCSKEDLPIQYWNAIIAVEDHRFYQHGPIDPIALLRAFVVNVRSQELSEGGSTITQQVAKNLYYITEKDVVNRKIAEIFTAYELERNYSKDEILELYANTIYFGDGYYGIKEACQGYFGKDPKDMNLYESSMLAGVPNAPSAYAPTKNFDYATSRQKKVLRSMVEYGYISQEEADQAIANSQYTAESFSKSDDE